MKKFTLLRLLPVGLLLMGLYSCAPKYGAYFSNSSTFYKSKKESVAKAPQATQQPDQLRKKEADMEPISAEQLVASSEKIIPMAPNPSIEKLVEEHKQRIEHIENSTLKGHEMEKALKVEKKRAKKEIKKEVKKEIKKIKAENDDDEYVVMLILAVLIPPLAVGLTYGIVDKFWISLLLTLLFWLPGAIYSVIVVNDYYK